MEQIKVNMIPNGEVKTIHCSKGDGKTRKWGFELYKEDGIIPSSSISPQMFFDSYKGGTEQILPENTSNPTTSPIIADIQYPDALRSEQEFLYRESPATVDGKAKITKIKGNTLVWNQLVEPIMASVTTTENGITCVNNGDGSFTINGTATGTVDFRLDQSTRTAQDNLKSYTQGSYICTSSFDGKSENDFVMYIRQYGTWENKATFSTTRSKSDLSANFDNCFIFIRIASGVSFSNFKFYPQIINITKLGSSAITDATSFRTYFPLPYYDYTQGKLLPFKGEELKTTGKNSLDISTIQIGKNWVYGSASDRAIIEFDVEPNTDYKMQISNLFSFGFVTVIYKTGYFDTQLSNVSVTSTEQAIHTPNNCEVICVQFGKTDISSADFYGIYVCALASTYSTLSLPTLTYFPTGMKSAGSIYDELTESKAITRLTKIVLDGTQTAQYEAFNGICKMAFVVPDCASWTDADSIDYSVKSNYLLPTSNALSNNGVRGIHRRANGSSNIMVSLGSEAYSSGITDATKFRQYLADNPLTVIYPLATPTDTPINTASLVSEQAEIPLYEDDDILIGECTTQLSSESGFIPTKIKYQDDSGVAYSQKINLHVEK